jgi:cell division protease FtsH
MPEHTPPPPQKPRGLALIIFSLIAVLMLTIMMWRHLGTHEVSWSDLITERIPNGEVAKIELESDSALVYPTRDAKDAGGPYRVNYLTGRLLDADNTEIHQAVARFAAKASQAAIDHPGNAPVPIELEGPQPANIFTNALPQLILVEELVAFLKNPKKFQKLGGRIPRGVLLVGPPGTGKTLLAKAIAGEADVPFYSISGSDFVEMFVGVGASRVRDLFNQSKENAPCIIFIDEIDAVGRKRGSGMNSGGHDEREQTLNAILVEMDGFSSTDKVIVIAATNRVDVLDPALLRPGRFDRHMYVNLPDIAGREQILTVHASKVKLDPRCDLSIIARGTPGFSGADLESLINEAALNAARYDQEVVQHKDLEYARDRVAFGRERKAGSRAMPEDERLITAYHEAGHSLLQILVEGSDDLHKVTIIPRGRSLGSTMHLPSQDRHTHGKRKLLGEICVLFGGRIAEELFCGDITTGASNDIERATRLARGMVYEWGMSDKMGPIKYTEEHEYPTGQESVVTVSATTRRELDEEVRSIIDSQFARAKKLVEEHRDQLERVARALLEHETLDGAQVQLLLAGGELPPRRSTVTVQKGEPVREAKVGAEAPKPALPTPALEPKLA